MGSGKGNHVERALKRLKIEERNNQRASSSADEKNKPISRVVDCDMASNQNLGIKNTSPSSKGKDKLSKWILETETIGSRGQIRKVEFVRLINQALKSLGYENTAKLLEEESGIDYQPEAVTTFRDGVLEGNWDLCISKLGQMPLDDHENREAKFLILQQKYLELLEVGNTVTALQVLRTEMVPLSVNVQKIHDLAGLVICKGAGDLREKAGWNGSGQYGRYSLLLSLQGHLPPSIMIPENRLLKLVEDNLDSQREKCFFHNGFDNIYSLYVRHECGKDRIPYKTVQVAYGPGLRG